MLSLADTQERSSDFLITTSRHAYCVSSTRQKRTTGVCLCKPNEVIYLYSRFS